MSCFYNRVLLVGAVCMLLPWSALAQNQNNGDPSGVQPSQAQQGQPQRRFAVLAQRLNLTKEQKQRWTQINRDTNQKVWAARKDDSLNESQMQGQLRRIHREQKEQVAALLTPDQQQELKSFWQELKQKQQNAASDSDGSKPAQDSGSDQEDDLFAGMVSDDPAPSQPPANKAPAHK